MYTHILNKNTFPQLLNILKAKKMNLSYFFIHSSIDEKFTQILDTTKSKKIFAQNVSNISSIKWYEYFGIANSNLKHG